MTISINPLIQAGFAIGLGFWFSIILPLCLIDIGKRIWRLAASLQTRRNAE